MLSTRRDNVVKLSIKCVNNILERVLNTGDVDNILFTI